MADHEASPAPLATDPEIEQLRAQVAALEAELVEVTARANEQVAKWQERAYWLDRWHLDLNGLMRKPGASQFRAVVRALRSVVWGMQRLKRRLSGS
jgi:hypothetical protein